MLSPLAVRGPSPAKPRAMMLEPVSALNVMVLLVFLQAAKRFVSATVQNRIFRLFKTGQSVRG